MFLSPSNGSLGPDKVHSRPTASLVVELSPLHLLACRVWPVSLSPASRSECPSLRPAARHQRRRPPPPPLAAPPPTGAAPAAAFRPCCRPLPPLPAAAPAPGGLPRPKHHLFKKNRSWCIEGSCERKRMSLRLPTSPSYFSCPSKFIATRYAATSLWFPASLLTNLGVHWFLYSTSHTLNIGNKETKRRS